MNTSEWAFFQYVVKRNNAKAGTFIRDVLLEECAPFLEEFEKETGIKVDTSLFDKSAHFAEVGKASAKRRRKLTAEQVLDIDFDRNKRGLSWGQIANKYKVTRSTARAAVNRRFYADVPKEKDDV
jgi:hypothetical protein